MYNINYKLGSGSTSDVYSINDKGTNVAVKVMFNNYELEDIYAKLHTYKNLDIFIKPYNFLYFDYYPINEDETKLNISMPTKDKQNARFMTYFMEELYSIDLSRTNREKYILFIYKFIEQCKLLDVFDSDAFSAIMLTYDGDFVFYDLDGVYFTDLEGRDSVLTNLVFISPHEHFSRYTYFDSKIFFDYEITKRFMELYMNDLISVGIELPINNVYSFNELKTIIDENEELIEKLNNFNLMDFIIHWQ